MKYSEGYIKWSAGVGMVMAKLGSTARPTLTINVDGDQWTVKSETTFKTNFITFKLGEEFDEVTVDDRHMKVQIRSIHLKLKLFFVCLMLALEI